MEQTVTVRLRDGAARQGAVSAGDDYFDFAYGPGPWRMPASLWARLQPYIGRDDDGAPVIVTDGNDFPAPAGDEENGDV